MIKNRDLKTFAFIWATIFLGIGLFPILNENQLRIWSIAIAIIFLLIAIIKPFILKGFYLLWVKVGEIIGGIISKMIMFILFFSLFTIVSFILKLLGKDLLRKKIIKNESTYWIDREDQPQSMKNQF